MAMYSDLRAPPQGRHTGSHPGDPGRHRAAQPLTSASQYEPRSIAPQSHWRVVSGALAPSRAGRKWSLLPPCRERLQRRCNSRSATVPP